MLSYQHCFHAGNHADVLKHLCWFELINHLNIKSKPYCLIDSHSGDGLYHIDDIRNKERSSGVETLNHVDTQSDLLNGYIELVDRFQGEGVYPGSPAIALALMRKSDSFHMLEKHPTAFANLKQFVRQKANKNLHTHLRDAFEGLIALTPPPIRRGGILIDPPYEQIEEYEWVANAVSQTHKRWQQAAILVWYPLLGKRAKMKADACRKMLHAITQLDIECWGIELQIANPKSSEGMYGSGVIAINPPWTLADNVSKAVKDVAKNMGENALINEYS